jgi:protein-arginine kinase
LANDFATKVFFLSGIHGEHTESVGGVYDISNKRRLGLSEIDAVTEMANGVAEIIKMERELGEWILRTPSVSTNSSRLYCMYQSPIHGQTAPNGA